MTKVSMCWVFVAAAILAVPKTALAEAASTAFTYQGRLNLAGQPVSDSADFIVSLWDAELAGAQIGGDEETTDVVVLDGLFTLELDFGAEAFGADARWLQIEVRSPAGQGNYVPLTPRQRVTAAPFATQTRGIFVDGSRNVGIGTQDPAVNLHISNQNAAFMMIEADTDNAGENDNASIFLTQDGGDVAARIGYRFGQNKLEMVNQYADSLILGTNNVDMLTMLQSGNVGIGTDAPAGALHVVDTDFSSLRVESSSTSGTWFRLNNTSTGGDEWNFISTGEGNGEGPGKLLFHNGSTRMTLAENGSLGLGTAEPASKMHVASSGPVTLTLEADTDNITETDNAGIILSQDGGAVIGRIGFRDDSNDLEIINEYDAGLRLGTLGADAMTIDADGDVGIGTQSPTSALHVVDSSWPSMRVDSSSAVGTWLRLGNTSTGGGDWNLISTGESNGEGAGKLLIVNDDTRMVVDEDGDVGIGISNPTDDLDVKGDIAVTSEFADRSGRLTTYGPNGSQNVRITYLDGSPNHGWIGVKNENGETMAQMYVNSGGDGVVKSNIVVITGGSDIAEPYNIHGPADGETVPSELADVQPGTVVSIDPRNPGELCIASKAYDTAVAGIISGAGGINPGMTLQQPGTIADGKHPVAMTGRVWCNVDADANGSIQPGDILTTSDTPGHAMKATDRSRAMGTVIGKAMTSLESGQGLVLVLVNLQ